MNKVFCTLCNRNLRNLKKNEPYSFVRKSRVIFVEKFSFWYRNSYFLLKWFEEVTFLSKNLFVNRIIIAFLFLQSSVIFVKKHSFPSCYFLLFLWFGRFARFGSSLRWHFWYHQPISSGIVRRTREQVQVSVSGLLQKLPGLE